MSDVHKLHCEPDACKYGDDDCPVVAKHRMTTPAAGRDGNGSEYEYRHLSLPGSDGECVWLQWQRFTPKMQIRHNRQPPSAQQGQFETAVLSAIEEGLEEIHLRIESIRGHQANTLNRLRASSAPSTTQEQGEAVAELRVVRTDNGRGTRTYSAGIRQTREMKDLCEKLPHGEYKLYTSPAPPEAAPVGEWTKMREVTEADGEAFWVAYHKELGNLISGAVVDTRSSTLAALRSTFPAGVALQPSARGER